MTEAQIKHMVDRFLGWKLPENFNPDDGISFKRTFNENTAHPMKHEPHGTNLLDAPQAEAMVRHMIDGMPKQENRLLVQIGQLYTEWLKQPSSEEVSLLLNGLFEIAIERDPIRMETARETAFTPKS